VREGDLPLEVFGHWLVQDRHFVEALFPSVCRVLAQSPPEDRPLLVEALQGVVKHIEWFDAESGKRGLEPGKPPTSVSHAYMDFLTATSLDSYPVGIVLLWGQYRVYLDAWTAVGRVPAAFRDAVAQWSSPRYRRFVGRCGRAADRALRTASDRELKRAEKVFEQMLHYELAFWVSVLEDTPKARTARAGAGNR